MTVAAGPAHAASPGDLPARLDFASLNVSGAADNPQGKATALDTLLQVQNEFYAPFGQDSATVTTLTVKVTFPTNRIATGTPTSTMGSG